MALDKVAVQAIHKDIIAALAAVAKKHNLSTGKTHITYNDAGFKFTGEFGSKDVMGDANPKFYKDMQRFGFLHDLSVEDIGKTFVRGATTFKIEGAYTRNWIICQNQGDKKSYKISPADVKACYKKD